MEAADTRPRSTRRRHQRRMRTDTPSDGDLDFLRSGGNLPSESSRQTQKKPLNFTQAMSDFQTMFPHIEKDIIEAVLRSNDGVVQTTIDQLLVLSETAEDNTATEDQTLPGYHESHDYNEDLPPSYDEVENEILSEFTREVQEFESRRQSCLSPVADTYESGREERTNLWNPPLVGALPPDFLRITDDQSVNDVCDGTSFVGGGMMESSREGFLSDKDLDQFLEDEKLATFLQNEEFMRQLRRDPDFLMSLEEDYRKFVQTREPANRPSSPPIEPGTRGAVATHAGGARPRNPHTSYDDATFNKKLIHMGKTTRKKFGKMAKKFSRKKGPKFTPLGGSTANLLDEELDENVSEKPWLEDIQESANGTDTSEQNQVPELKEATGRKLPQAPSGARNPNSPEPIVFYSEDNEFEYKHDY